MSLGDFQFLDKKPIVNSNFKGDFLKVYHQKAHN